MVKKVSSLLFLLNHVFIFQGCGGEGDGIDSLPANF